ncbi:hypothetical protein Nepgr_010752 [Nepenthes gracilis]|uniref:Uncharacterized protein n=1 Tax=Nepenthes gracilis TaxID=150966 RepID=A0AAD3SE13_NEPGR|nr:hypothetical protein Nepgr_010752 [Nepenthes gracilis]
MSCRDVYGEIFAAEFELPFPSPRIFGDIARVPLGLLCGWHLELDGSLHCSLKDSASTISKLELSAPSVGVVRKEDISTSSKLVLLNRCSRSQRWLPHVNFSCSYCASGYLWTCYALFSFAFCDSLAS